MPSVCYECGCHRRWTVLADGHGYCRHGDIVRLTAGIALICAVIAVPHSVTQLVHGDTRQVVGATRAAGVLTMDCEGEGEGCKTEGMVNDT